MTEVNPPAFIDGQCYTFEKFRQTFGGIVCVPGVGDYFSDLKVTAVGGGSLNVSVAAGDAWVEGDLNGSSGMYHIRNDGAVVMTIGANGAGSSRTDLIIASIYDSQYIGAADQWALEVVQGVAGAGTPAVPASTRSGYIVLSAVTVPASGGTPSVVDDTNREHMSTCGVDPYCELTNTGATSVPHNSATKIALATTVHNDTAFFTVASSVITVLVTGVYDLFANGGFVSSPITAEFDLSIGLNGATSLPGTGVYSANVNLYAAVTGRQGVGLTAGDTLQLQAYQFQSSAAAAVNTVGAGACRLSVRKVG